MPSYCAKEWFFYYLSIALWILMHLLWYHKNLLSPPYLIYSVPKTLLYSA